LLNIEDKRKNELFHLKQNFDAKTKKANKVITEIEASRDAKIKTYSAAEEKIEDLTTNIIEKINELAKNREEVILEFDELGIRQRKANVLLVYLPFYLSCFQRKSAKRYIYLVPSAVSDQCFSARLKALGKARISQLLQPRFDKLTSILNSFMCLLDENIVFNREISEACMKANLLQMKKAQEIVRKGLSKLNEQGWVSNSEFESF
ncbi:unnamed protein product, partial [marine sediment metagenome]